MKPSVWIFVTLVGASATTFAALATSDEKIASAMWGAQAAIWLCAFVWETGKCLLKAIRGS